MTSETATSPRKSGWVRPLAKWTGIILLGLVVFLVVAVIALRIWIGTGSGRSVIEAQLEKRVIAGQRVSLEGFEGDILSDASIARIEVRDEDGLWLSIDDLNLDWSPWALLSREVNVETFTASELHVRRQPVLPPSEPKEETEPGGEAPVDRIRLGRFAIDEIRIDEPVIGEPLQASLSATLDATEKNGRIALDLTPTLGFSDRVDLDLGWTDGKRVDGEIDLLVQRNSVLVRTFLGRELPGDVTLQGRVEGALGDWAATLNGQVGNEQLVELNGAGTQTGQTLNATLYSGPLSRLVGQENLPGMIGPVIELDLTGTRDGDVVNDFRLALLSDLATVTATTPRLQTDDPQAASWTFAAKIDDPSRLPLGEDMQVGAVAIEGRADKSGKTWTVPVTLSVASFETDAIALRNLQGPLDIVFDGDAVEADLDLATVIARLEGGQGVAGNRATLVGAARYELESQNARLTDLTLSLPGTRLTASGLYGVETGQMDLQTTVRSDRPQMFAAQAPGSVDLRATVRGSLAETLDIAVSGNAKGFEGLPPDAGVLLGETATIDLKARRRSNGAIDVNTFTLDGQNVSATANGTLGASGNAGFVADLRINPVTLEAAPVVIGEPLSVNVRADGPFDALDYAITARSARLVIAEEPVEALDLSVSGRRDGSDLSGRLNIDARVQDKPLAANGRFALAENMMQVEDLVATWNGLDLGANARLAGESRTVSFSLEGAPEGLDLFDSANLRGSLENEQVSVNGVIAGLNAAVVEDGEVVLGVSGTLDALTAQVDFTGDTLINGVLRETTADLSADVTLGDGGPRVLARLDGMLGDLPFQTLEPVIYEATDTGPKITGTLGLLGGTMTIDALLGEVDPRLGLVIDGLAVADISRVAVLPVTGGRIDGRVDLTRSQGPLRGLVALDITGIPIEEAVENTPELSLAARGEIVGDRFDIDATLLSDDAVNIRITGGLGLDVPETGLFPAPAMQAPMNIRATGHAELARLWAATGRADIAVAGRAELDFAVAGTPETPDVGGSIILADGEVEQESFGIRLEQIGLRAQFADDRIILESVNANSVPSGSLSASGTFDIAARTGNIDIVLDELMAVNRRDAEVAIDGELNLAAGTESAKITGDLRLMRGFYTLVAPQGSGSTGPTIDVRFEDEPVPEQEDEPAYPVFLDIAFKAPGQFGLNGFGLDTEVGADLKISGTVSEPRVRGAARIIRGDFEFIGKTFKFEESRINLDGPLDRITLDIEARRKLDDVTAVVSIKGKPTEPKIEMSAIPELPQDEVLSRVLFGRSPAQLSAIQAAQLAAGLNKMRGGNSAFDLMGSIERVAGLDSISIDQSASGDTELTTGKYLTEDVFLEVKTGASGAPSASIEWEAFNNVDVGAQLGSDGNDRLSVEYSRDYE